jgi:hypothetical protein
MQAWETNWRAESKAGSNGGYLWKMGVGAILIFLAIIQKVFGATRV